MQWLALMYVCVPVGALCLVRPEEGDGSPGTGNKFPPLAYAEYLCYTATWVPGYIF